MSHPAHISGIDADTSCNGRRIRCLKKRPTTWSVGTNCVNGVNAWIPHTLISFKECIQVRPHFHFRLAAALFPNAGAATLSQWTF